MPEDVLHTDDPTRPGNVTAEEYRAELEEFARTHPKGEIPADQYCCYSEDEL